MSLNFLKAPKLPKTTDQSKVSSNANSGVAGGSIMNGVASTAELDMYRRRREAMIQRGEDPDAVAKAQKARHDSRKQAVKKLFGMKIESSKGDVTQYQGSAFSGSKGDVTLYEGSVTSVRDDTGLSRGYYKPTSGHAGSADGVIR
ncbi:hypothetical protein VTL71DRAFT_13132 [Oculimacula yallundae]|uniref:Uncharacterized protein n=1 Tax=Oculimacula yallundae TaxID=86028 RepID=A0ABR4CQQ1_9HELO